MAIVRGKLFYIMGASGSGKDTLLKQVLERQQDKQLAVGEIRVVQRFITRSADAGGESHFEVDTPSFQAMVESGDFCMFWQAHGFHYGIHREIIDWLDQGIVVIVNGSRAYLPEARRVIPELTAVLLQVSDAVQASRLTSRAREGSQEIADRLKRKVDLSVEEGDFVVINNDSNLENSVNLLCKLIEQK